MHMAHRILTGSFAALEARLIEEIAALQSSDPLAPVAVLVGSNLLASYLRGRTAGRGRSAANLRFYTFLDLATRLASASDGAGRKARLPHLGPSAVLENILAAQPPPVFARVSGLAGFRDALLDTFRDLRDAGIGPAELDEGVRKCVELSPDRRDHLSGLADLYRSFRKKVELFHGVDDEFRAAAANAGNVQAILGTPVLMIYGIYDVTGQQTDLLSELKNAIELHYFVPYVDDAVSSFALPFVEARSRELRATAEALPPEIPPTSLGRLAQSDFGFRSQVQQGSAPDGPSASAVPVDSSFALISAPGESRAAVEVIREILSAARDGVIAGFHEAAVILRQPEEQAPVMTEAFRIRGIPYFLEGGRSFLTRALGRAVVAIANLESSSFSRQAILTAMELVAAALPADPAADWDVPDWRALTNDPRFLSGVDAWDSGTKALVREATRNLKAAEEGEAEEADEGRAISVPAAKKKLTSARALQTAWGLLRTAASEWPNSLSWRDWARLLQSRLEPLLSRCSDWAAFSTVLDELTLLSDAAARAGIDAGVSRGRLTSALIESLSARTFSDGRFQRSGVNLLSPASARGLRFPLVIIPGLDEGRFPARLRQDPLLLDAERRSIGKPPRLPLKSQRGEEEKLLFDMAARSAERRLAVMTSRLDESSDRERIPSEFFLRIASAACGAAVRLRDIAAGAIPGLRSVSLDYPAPGKGQIAVDDGEIRLRLVTAGPASPRVVLSALESEDPHLLKGPIAYDKARWSHELTEFDGRIADPGLVRAVAAKIGPSAGQVSSSRLEEYARCPYLFYLKRVIGLEAWIEQEPPEGMDPLERGQAVHAILDQFLKEYAGEKFASIPIETLRKSLSNRARAALDTARPAAMPDLLWEIEREGLEKLLMNWLDWETERVAQGLLPVQSEVAFGKFSYASETPGLRLQAGRHLFVFRGRIDRIDLSGEGYRARVIDYKTGMLPRSMDKRQRPLLMGGEKIQIAVYRGALAVVGGFERLETVEGEYLHLQPRDGEIVPCSFSDESLDEAYRRLPEILEIMGDGIEGGVFFARASGTVRPDGHCEYCDFLPVCGRDRIQREERKANDPEVRKFLRILDIDAASEETS
jgi:RecB family exonuclease